MQWYTSAGLLMGWWGGREDVVAKTERWVVSDKPDVLTRAVYIPVAARGALDSIEQL
ncbi:MAG: hypothetical protein ACODAD_07365 [Planctomycetota bacterium]